MVAMGGCYGWLLTGACNPMLRPIHGVKARPAPGAARITQRRASRAHHLGHLQGYRGTHQDHGRAGRPCRRRPERLAHAREHCDRVLLRQRRCRRAPRWPQQDSPRGQGTKHVCKRGGYSIGTAARVKDIFHPCGSKFLIENYPERIRVYLGANFVGSAIQSGQQTASRLTPVVCNVGVSVFAPSPNLVPPSLAGRPARPRQQLAVPRRQAHVLGGRRAIRGLHMEPATPGVSAGHRVGGAGTCCRLVLHLLGILDLGFDLCLFFPFLFSQRCVCDVANHIPAYSKVLPLSVGFSLSSCSSVRQLRWHGHIARR